MTWTPGKPAVCSWHQCRSSSVPADPKRAEPGCAQGPHLLLLGVSELGPQTSAQARQHLLPILFKSPVLHTVGQQ